MEVIHDYTTGASTVLSVFIQDIWHTIETALACEASKYDPRLRGRTTRHSTGAKTVTHPGRDFKSLCLTRGGAK